MLQALKITKKSFNKYLQLPLRKEEGRLNYEQAKGFYIVKDTRDIRMWKCVSKPYFDVTYKFVTESHPTQFRTIEEIKMPTGYPNDPAAYAAKQAAASQRRAAAKAANSGKPVKRTYKKVSHTTSAATGEPTTTTTVVDAKPRVHKKRAYTPRKTAASKTTITATQKGTAATFKVSAVQLAEELAESIRANRELQTKLDASQKEVVNLEAALEKLQDRYDGCDREWEAMQDRALTAERRLASVLDLI